MKPTQVTNILRKMASAIENSKCPQRGFVAQDLQKVILAIEEDSPPEEGGSLKDKLNSAKIYSMSKGKGKVGLYKDDEDGETIEVTDEYPDAVLYFDEHPEGSDRGGYVPWMEFGGETVYYYEPAGEWED